MRVRLTCAMPEPISPPPMTVTCLKTIFFAEAEAVDEDAMARRNCLVTKAMVRRRRRRRKGRWRLRNKRDKNRQEGACNAPTAAADF